MSGDLIDTTEMYLRTIYELTEEGVVPLRARIAERLSQSGPTVSQTVARMQRDGLLTVADDRHLELTAEGQAYATRVMRKHRLAERLLVDVIGLDWALVHDEACRWEHVISDDVERRLLEILDNPTTSPYGNPIPGLSELGGVSSATASPADVPADNEPAAEVPVVPIREAVPSDAPSARVEVVRIAEPLQGERDLMTALRAAGATPGGTVHVEAWAGGVVLRDGRSTLPLASDQAAHVYVRRAD